MSAIASRMDALLARYRTADAANDEQSRQAALAELQLLVQAAKIKRVRK